MRMALAIVLVGCTEHGTHPPTDDQSGACTLLDGRAFASQDLQDCGLTPEGPAQCRWRIEFAASPSGGNSQFTWTHDDVGEAGGVFCDHDKLLTVRAGGPLEIGRYDAATDRVTWDAIVYVPE